MYLFDKILRTIHEYLWNKHLLYFHFPALKLPTQDFENHLPNRRRNISRKPTHLVNTLEIL